MNDLLISILRQFETHRKERIDCFPSPACRQEYAEAIASCFLPCSRQILAGHFKIISRAEDKESTRLIYPTAIELYYHEEGPGRFKDPIMYHTNDRKRAEDADYFSKRGISGLPYYSIGSLNPHTSGIDVTFENPVEQYRASFLIREYEVDYGNGVVRNVKNSTDIYDDLLLAGIPLENADWIEWCDGNTLKEEEIIRRWRRNVPDYRPVEGQSEKWEKNPFGEPSFKVAGHRYAKCPFNWQFAKK